MSTLVVDYNGNSGVTLKSDPIKLRVGNGIKGFVDAFHEVFTPSVQVKYIFLHYLRSIGVGEDILIGRGSVMKNPSKDSDYLTLRKLTGSAFSPGEIEITNIDAIDKKIADIENEILELKSTVEISQGERSKLLAEKKYLLVQ